MLQRYLFKHKKSLVESPFKKEIDKLYSVRAKGEFRSYEKISEQSVCGIKYLDCPRIQKQFDDILSAILSIKG